MKYNARLSVSVVGLLVLGAISSTGLMAANQPIRMFDRNAAVTKEADSTVVKILPDGTKIIRGDDGAMIEKRTDGTKIVTKPDGTSVTIKPDGSKVIKGRDGTTIEVKPGQ